MPTDAYWLERATRSAQRRTPERGPLVGVTLLPPHASLRRYARAQFQTEGDEIVMLMPPKDAAPDEAGGQARGQLQDDPFVITQRWLADAELPVPALYDVDIDGDALWLEDLGPTDLDAWVTTDPERLVPAYERAIDLLVSFQRAALATTPPSIVQERTFGADILRWELEHYVEWRVEAYLGHTVTPAQRGALDREFTRLVDVLAAVPTMPMHRDYQSHNIMVRPSGDLVMLDFQDAMIGPAVYDAVALLRDSYVVLPNAILSALVSRYAEQVAGTLLPHTTPAELVNWFNVQTIQRKLKDAGRFVFIDRVKKNPGFLGYIDDSVRYVQHAFSTLGDDWSGLAEIISDIDPEAAP